MAEEPARQEKTEKSQQQTAERSRLVEAITSPLNFFALIVTACEAILGLTTAGLSEEHRYNIACTMAALLGLLIVVVAVLTYLKPRHVSPEMAKALEKSEDAKFAAQNALAIAEQAREIFSSTAFEDTVIRLIDERLQETKREIPPQTDGK